MPSLDSTYGSSAVVNASSSPTKVRLQGPCSVHESKIA